MPDICSATFWEQQQSEWPPGWLEAATQAVKLGSPVRPCGIAQKNEI